MSMVELGVPSVHAITQSEITTGRKQGGLGGTLARSYTRASTSSEPLIVVITQARHLWAQLGTYAQHLHIHVWGTPTRSFGRSLLAELS